MTSRYAPAALALSLLAAGSAHAQGVERAADADWPMYHRDLAGTRFSPLEELTPRNAARLELAWRYKFNRAERERIKGPSSFEMFQQVTPIVVNGVMYMPSGDRVVALEPETGKEIWRTSCPKASPRSAASSYWPGEGRSPAHFLHAPAQNRSHSTREPARWTSKVRPQRRDRHSRSRTPARRRYTRTSCCMGSQLLRARRAAHRPHLTTIRGRNGDSHAYDARTGKKVWEFHTIPLPGEAGPRDLGQRQLEESYGQQRLVVHADRRRAARHRLHAGERAGHELLRRRPARQQPVQQLRRSRSTRRRASGSGTSRTSTTRSGTTTCRPRPG